MTDGTASIVKTTGSGKLKLTGFKEDATNQAKQEYFSYYIVRVQYSSATKAYLKVYVRFYSNLCMSATLTKAPDAVIAAKDSAISVN